MITDIKNNIIDLTNQLQSEKNNDVWDMEEVFYLDTSIRNSITSLIDYCRGINTGSAPDGFGLAMSSLTEEEWTLVNSTLIHEPLLLIRRRIQGRLYRAAYHWGSGQLLREEQPIKNRGLMMFFALLGFLLAPILTQVGYTQYIKLEPISENAVWWLIAMGVVALAGIIVGIILLVRVYKPHKIHSSGSGLSLFAFERLAPSARPPPSRPQQPADGQPVARFCPKCGDPLEPHQKFCEKCGQQMDGR